MLAYIVRKLIGAIVVLVGVSTIVFFVTFLSGDPAILMSPVEATVEEVEALRENLGLNDPYLVQYARFFSKAVQGDFGNSLRHREPALELALARLPATLELSLTGMFLAIITGIPLGVIAALHRQSFIDLFAMGIALIGQSMANFWLGIMLINIFAVKLNLLPSFGRGDWKHLILPAITLASRLIAILTRMTRATMLDELNEDYIRTARGKGLSEQVVIMRHAFRNALIPIVTIIALQFGALMAGTVIIETVFSWPGIGLLAVQAIYNRDYPLVQASVFILGVAFVGVNFIADIVYGILDPRMRLGN